MGGLAEEQSNQNDMLYKASFLMKMEIKILSSTEDLAIHSCQELEMLNIFIEYNKDYLIVGTTLILIICKEKILINVGY